jgi:phage terminase large subunit-like protein
VPIPDGLPLFEGEAARALRIFKRLRIPDVIGKPRFGDAAGEWFLRFVEVLFGAYDPGLNRRMIQEFFVLVPKKNSKSTGVAGIAVTAIILNRRPAAETLLVSSTKEVADITYSQADGMIRADPKLDDLFHLQRHIRTITHRRTEATIKIKAADADTITGSKATITLIDETHVFGKRADAMQIFVELRGALAARPDGFLLQITTQSKEPPAGVFKAELSTARAVRDGRLDLPLLPLLYELPDDLANDGGWKQRKYWPLINPNLGRSVDVAFLDRALIKAEDEGAEALALLASQHFNVEVGVGLKSDRWAGADFWEQAAEPGLTLEAILARCDVVCIGVDGGGLDDLLAIAVLGRETATRRWLLWVKAWAHVSVLERRKSEAPRLRDLEREGDLVITGEMEEAFAAVADIAAQVDAAGLLAKVGLDPMGVGAIVDALAERGIEGDDRVVGISQGWTLNGAIKTTEVKLASGALVHCGQPLLAWAVGNARVEPRGNAITITKQTAGSAKIDPLMATFDAVALMSRNPDAVGGSYLDTEDLILV